MNNYEHFGFYRCFAMEFHCSQLTKHCRVCGGRLVGAKKSKRSIYSSQSYKKELKLAYSIDVIIDHVEIHPPSFCKLCKLSMERVLNASRQKKLAPLRSLVVPFTWKAHTADKCEVSEE
mgnify:CR=1 FL=1